VLSVSQFDPKPAFCPLHLHQNGLLAPKEHELGTSCGAYILGSARSSVTRGWQGHNTAPAKIQ
jgi:hypothetical protein